MKELNNVRVSYINPSLPPKGYSGAAAPGKTISLTPHVIARVLGVMAFSLTLAGIASQLTKYVLGHDYVMGLVPLFDLDAEENIPAFFSDCLLLSAALLLAVIAVLTRKSREPHVAKWGVLCCGFVYMAYDEAFQVHEKLIDPVTSLLGGGHLGFFYFAWVVPAIIVVCILAVYFARFLWQLPAKTRFRFLFAGAVYLSGAIGFELVGGRYAEIHHRNNLVYNLFPVGEESLEMAGAIIFVWALLLYIGEQFQSVRFRVRATERQLL